MRKKTLCCIDWRINWRIYIHRFLRERKGLLAIVVSMAVFSLAVTAVMVIHILLGARQLSVHGAVATSDERCSRVASSLMYNSSGNAVDAAVAAFFCMTVVQPQLASLGG